MGDSDIDDEIAKLKHELENKKEELAKCERLLQEGRHNTFEKDERYAQAKLELSQKEAEEILLIAKAAKEWRVRSDTLKKHIKQVKETVTKLRSLVSSLEEKKKEVARLLTEQNDALFNRKTESFFGNALNVIGVVAAPLSFGTSLVLNVGSAALAVKGVVDDYCPSRDFSKEIDKLRDECNDVIKEINKHRADIEKDIRKIEILSQTNADIDRQIYAHFSEPDKKHLLTCKLGALYIPLSKICNVLQQKVTCTVFMKTVTSTVSINATVSVVAGIAEGTISINNALQLTIQTTTQTIIESSVMTLSMFECTINVQRCSITSVNAVLGSKVLVQKTCSNAAMQTSSQASRVKQVSCGMRISRAKTTKTVSKAVQKQGINKLNLFVSSAFLLADFYALATHENRKTSAFEIEVQEQTARMSNDLDNVEKYICEAQKQMDKEKEKFEKEANPG